MGSAFGTIKEAGLSSASGNAELGNHNLVQQQVHQLSLVPADGATGVVKVSVRPKGLPITYSEPLYQEVGVQAEIDLEAPESLFFEAFVGAVILDCSDVTGTFDAILESR